MDDREAGRPLDNYDRLQMEELRRLTVHRELAVANALHYCAEMNVQPPLWVVREASALICELLKREKTTKRGRTAGILRRYRQDIWDAERLDAVERMRIARKRFKDEMKLLRSSQPEWKGTGHWRDVERTLAWFRAGTFECASMYLKGRDARASANTIRTTYRRCHRRAAGDRRPDRYHLFDEDLLVKLGFPRFSERKPGTKFVRLSDLTP
jgi:hypothetical protein